MPLARQPEHQGFVHSGPLVLGAASLKSPTPTADRDRTVSRRSEPSSRTTLNGEQPYPWDLLQPQDLMSRHRGAKHRRRYELSGGISLLSPEYLLSVCDGPTIQNHRITKACFRTCSTCRSRSQALFCLYTQRTMSNRAESTFALLRYSLGGDRPSQTTHHTLSSARITDKVRDPITPEWYLKDDSTNADASASKSPTYPAQELPNLNVKL